MKLWITKGSHWRLIISLEIWPLLRSSDTFRPVYKASHEQKKFDFAVSFRQYCIKRECEKSSKKFETKNLEEGFNEKLSWKSQGKMTSLFCWACYIVQLPCTSICQHQQTRRTRMNPHEWHTTSYSRSLYTELMPVATYFPVDTSCYLDSEKRSKYYMFTLKHACHLIKLNTV